MSDAAAAAAPQEEHIPAVGTATSVAEEGGVNLQQQGEAVAPGQNEDEALDISGSRASSSSLGSSGVDGSTGQGDPGRRKKKKGLSGTGRRVLENASSLLSDTLRRLKGTRGAMDDDGATSPQCELHETTTADGWTLRFKHYTPSPEAADRHQRTHPVMLVHGLSANHRAYDLRRDQSLAWILCELGYHTWLIDLRGSGLSEMPRKGKKAVGWDVMAYVEDVKVAIDYVLEHHGAQQAHFVGHSLGGILGLLVAAAYSKDYGGKLRSITTLATAIFYGDSWWAHMKPMLPLADVVDFIDLRTLMKLYSPFVLWPSFVCHMTNVKRPDLQKVLNHVEKVSTKVFKDMATSFDPEGLCLDIGGGRQRVQDLLHNVSVPVLMISADFDRQCSIPSIKRTCELLTGSPKTRLVVCGPKPEYRHHYGHVDILIGSNTAQEVFPHVTDFLQESDDPAFVSPRHLGAPQAGEEGEEAEDEAEEPLDAEVEGAGGEEGGQREEEEGRGTTRTAAEGGEEEEEEEEEKEYVRLRHVMHDVMGVDSGDVLSPMQQRQHHQPPQQQQQQQQQDGDNKEQQAATST